MRKKPKMKQKNEKNERMVGKLAPRLGIEEACGGGGNKKGSDILRLAAVEAGGGKEGGHLRCCQPRGPEAD